MRLNGTKNATQTSSIDPTLGNLFGTHARHAVQKESFNFCSIFTFDPQRKTAPVYKQATGYNKQFQNPTLLVQREEKKAEEESIRDKTSVVVFLGDKTEIAMMEEYATPPAVAQRRERERDRPPPEQQQLANTNGTHAKKNNRSQQASCISPLNTLHVSRSLLYCSGLALAAVSGHLAPVSSQPARPTPPHDLLVPPSISRA